MYVVAQMQYDAVLEGMIKEAVVQQGWVSALLPIRNVRDKSTR